MSDTISLTGNIATPPERRVTPAGVVITSFRLASSQRRFDRTTGGWVDGETNWYTVSTYRGLAEHAYDSLHKTDRVVVIGRLRLREWDNGTKKGLAVEIDADSIGHDLLWGTTRFRKDEGQAQPPTDPVQTEGGDPADDASGADWGALGEMAVEAGEDAETRDESSLVSGSTPF